MQKAIFLNDRLEHINWSKFDYCYIGNEFCERLLPSQTMLEDVLTRCIQYSLSFTLVTPYVTDKGIETLVQLLEFISKKVEHFEIVVNDWGLLKLLEDYFNKIEIILGRILVSRYLSKFHGMIKTNCSDMDRQKIDFYCLFPDAFLSFLRHKDIYKMEFNSMNHLCTTHSQLNKEGFKAHIYFPYSYITTSRFCGAPQRYNAYMEEPTAECRHECMDYFASITNKFSDKKIVIRGNTYFIRQNNLLKDLHFKIDRIIYNDFINM